MMAPCVFGLGVPLIMLWIRRYQENQQMQMMINGELVGPPLFANTSLALADSRASIYVGSILILFIAGLVFLLRGLKSKDDSDS